MKKSYTNDFKAKLVIELLREEQTMNQLAGSYGVHVTQLAKWKKAVLEGIPELLGDKRKRDDREKEHEEELQELYAQIGELTTKLNWLKKKSGINV
jgi:transposase-like protein